MSPSFVVIAIVSVVVVILVMLLHVIATTAVSLELAVVVVGATCKACSCSRRVVSASNSSWTAHTFARSVEMVDERSTTNCPAAG